jgi:hypothetical protein
LKSFEVFRSLLKSWSLEVHCFPFAIRALTLECFLNDAEMQKKVCYMHGSVCAKRKGEWIADGIFKYILIVYCEIMKMIIVCVWIEQHINLHADIENPVDGFQVYKRFKKAWSVFSLPERKRGDITHILSPVINEWNRHREPSRIRQPYPNIEFGFRNGRELGRKRSPKPVLESRFWNPQDIHRIWPVTVVRLWHG